MDRSLRLTPHPFVEDEDRSRFSQFMVRWSSRCRTCGTVGYLTSNGWRHKPLSKSSKRLIELEEVQRAAPANRITVEQASAIVDALNPGLPDEDDEDDYDLEWQDDYDPE